MGIRTQLAAWPAAALLVMLCWEMGCGQEMKLGTVHTIFSTECTPYFTFQVMTVAYTHKRAGQPGNLTRIMSCNDEQWEMFNQEELDIVQTHITPQFSHNPLNDDYYSPYNKPCGVMHWLENVRPQEEWVLVIDSDIIFRQSFLPEELMIENGWALAAYYNYMQGGSNPMAMTHIPTVEPRNDTYGGNLNRRADEVGAFYYLKTRDLIKVAPLWKKYTEDVRGDPMAWKYSGDSFSKKGEKPWISEMYGWVFGMAQLGIKHVIDPTMQIYAGYYASDIPRLIHYGLTHTVLDYSYDKHNHVDFDAFMCPPWDLGGKRSKNKDGGLFPHPPFPHELPEKEMHEQYGQLMTIEFVNTINQALCERHRRVCPSSKQLKEECGRADAIGEELVEMFSLYDPHMCADNPAADCTKKAQQGMCITKWIEMNSHCRATCGLCRKDVPWKIPQSSNPASGDSSRDKNTEPVNVEEFMPLSHHKEYTQGPFLKEKQLNLASKGPAVPIPGLVSMEAGEEKVRSIAAPKGAAPQPMTFWTMVGIFLLIAVGYHYYGRRQRLEKNTEKDCKA